MEFSLNLNQGWFGHFRGDVTEAPDGIQRSGRIDGYISFPVIEFKKQMPVGIFVQPDGRRVTIRDYLIADGYACEKEIPGPVIFYRGEFVELGSVKGIWATVARRIRLPDGFPLQVHGMTGVWSMAPDAA